MWHEWETKKCIDCIGWRNIKRTDGHKLKDDIKMDSL